ncbi:MAG: protein kinase, partial [Planctomycetales bacterium]|nr:protein kinase [Planctomycetales bacterium]
MASSGIKHDFLDPPKDSADDLGTLGNYRVIRELGKGGMGYVFLAEDTRLKREVALKVMNQKIAGTPGSRKRFISEARAMASVHHDNVATIFEVGERKGTPFMAMELLEGATLENYREQNGEPDYHTIISYARDIARGLAAAHAQGIVHRDIKPANIWLDTKTNRIKILDFGLALAQTPVDQLSGRGAVVGTPGYLSPEQARSEPLDDRSDLYSTGVVLYELATGSLPLKTKTVAEQLIAILAHSPKPLRERNDKIPEPLAELIHRLMAKEPRDRYPSAKALEESLATVEVECEKKSDLAQAINQLQLGLEQAVKKNADKDVFGLGDPEHAPPNPFEMLPDVLPPAAPIAGGVGSSGIHPAVPIGSGPLAAGPVAAGGPTAKPKPATPASNSKVIYIAAAASAALILLLIPLIVYLSDSSAIARQQSQNPVVVSSNPGSTASNPNNSGASNSSQTKQQPKQTQQANNQQPKKSSPPNTGGPNSTSPKNTAPKNTGPKNTTPVINKVSATKVDGAIAEGSKWIINVKQNNGS